MNSDVQAATPCSHVWQRTEGGMEVCQKCGLSVTSEALRQSPAYMADVQAATPESTDDSNVEPEGTASERILAWAKKYGVTMQADFVPCSQSRNAKPAKPARDANGVRWIPTLNWRIMLWRELPAPSSGKRSICEPFDYSAGYAHAPSYKKPLRTYGRDTVGNKNAIAWECENGFQARESMGSGNFMARDRKAPILPEFESVLAGLSMDSHVLDAGGFESWASEYGYETDSRKAEAIYKACLEQALAVRSALGNEAMEALADAASGY